MSGTLEHPVARNAADSTGLRRTVRAVCPHDCPDACAMLAVVEDGRVLAVRGDPDQPFTRGFLCHKVARYPERVHHADRLLFPQRRTGPKGSGRFERISWDEALDLVAARMREIAAGPHGPQAVLPYSYCGTMGKIQGESLDRRFFHRLGASLLARTICATAGVAGYRATIGAMTGTDPEAVEDARFVVNWGSNTAVTNVHLWVRMHEARRRGAKIVTVDPYRSRTAERSDWHLAPKVGTDAALALGVMHVIFREKLADEDYLARYCLGSEALRERVLSEWDPDRTARVTGLPRADVERFAIEYATTAPAVIRMNYGLQRHAGGAMAVRTLACLPAVIGAWRHPAGGALLSTSAGFPLDLPALQRPDLSPPDTRTVNMSQLAEALAGELPGPPVKLLYVYNSNPAVVAPDQRRVREGLRREDLFVVVHEQFPTDTALLADVLLPATTQLEHFDLHTSYGHHYVQLNEPAIPPPGECRCNTDVFRGLARRLGFEPELFDVPDDELARIALGERAAQQPERLRGITVDRLRREGWVRLNVPPRQAPFAEGNFPTPSGKCELFSESLRKSGTDPLPCFVPPAESPDSAPELAARYPLQLLAPPSPHFLESSFANVPSLRRSAREPEIELHPDDAAPRGIGEGDAVRIFNDRGAFFATARLRSDLRPGLACAPSLWWSRDTRDGCSANAVTSTRLTDLGGGATFFDVLVEAERVES